jgi:phosphate transport system ATP-binding protein
VPETTHSVAVSAPSSSETIQLSSRDQVFALDNVTVSYAGKPAVADVTLSIPKHLITAFIGPSGCGKSTLLRSLNRMNDLVPGASVTGPVHYHGTDLYSAGIDPVEVRRRIGMVFQRPNPFPKSIFDNVAYGPRALGMKGSMADRVEAALRRAALWDESKDILKRSALGLSGGQQQRLCIARALAVEPDVLLLDEPCSALDPISTARIEELMTELRNDYTLVVVTHNMQQAARIADATAFFSLAPIKTGNRAGVLVEFGPTTQLFSNPTDSRTDDYVQGRFG